MDRILLNLICFVLLTSVILPGLCENCQDTDNCLEFESSRNKCKECKWLYAGDCCEKHCPEGAFDQNNCSERCKCNGDNFEKGCDITSGACRCKPGWSSTTCDRRDSTITLDTTSDSTVLLNTTDMTKDVNGTGISEGREVPLSSIIASVIGVAVIMATSSVCVVCAVRRAHGNRSFFGNGTESSQRAEDAYPSGTPGLILLKLISYIVHSNSKYKSIRIQLYRCSRPRQHRITCAEQDRVE
ncbi:uncharacterized protein LOC110443009 isoform X3 [Mizuhopecten yessoensis]|uniref:uncharacterized protein LOC110443009 isoform X3 n=1 Tax=Mizuhopecten yessoensis TaxID=6573 RepID=UPI000B458545|nr:uncharacterized protein LOC110443009 isoform X3 [Mizuhopecten yessoensis]